MTKQVKLDFRNGSFYSGKDAIFPSQTVVAFIQKEIDSNKLTLGIKKDKQELVKISFVFKGNPKERLTLTVPATEIDLINQLNALTVKGKVDFKAKLTRFKATVLVTSAVIATVMTTGCVRTYDNQLDNSSSNVSTSTSTVQEVKNDNPMAIVIKINDNLWDISQKYGVSVEDLKKYNNLENNTIYDGDILWLESQYEIDQLGNISGFKSLPDELIIEQEDYNNEKNKSHLTY